MELEQDTKATPDPTDLDFARMRRDLLSFAEDEETSMVDSTPEEIEELLSDEPFGCECDDESPCCSHADQAHILLKLCRQYRAAAIRARGDDAG